MTTTTTTTVRYNCRILYSTQSGRAKACARRVARIVASYNTTGSSSNDIPNIIIRLMNGNGTTFDDEIGTKISIMDWANSFVVQQSEAVVESFNNNNNKKHNQSVVEEEKNLLLLFVSTTGDGEQTDTIQQTWKQLLQRSLPNNLFTKVSIGLFCLGDRAYGTQFCAAGRKVGTRFVQLGAQLFCDIGYGDDNTPMGGIFADLDNWIYTILLPKLYPPEYNSSSITNNVTTSQTTTTTTNYFINEPPYRVRIIQNSDSDSINVNTAVHNESMNEFFQQQCPVTAYQYVYTSDSNIIIRQNHTTKSSEQQFLPLLGTIISNEKLIQNSHDEQQDTRHFRIDVSMSSSSSSDSSSPPSNNINNVVEQQQKPQQSSYQDLLDTQQLPYRAGDVASILPVMSIDEVNRFIAVLPPSIQAIVDDDIEIIYSPQSSYFYPGVCYPYWPKRCTIRGLLTYCANICALPEREDLRTLGYYCCPNEYHSMGSDQRDKLIALSETSLSALYVDYILREKRTWADVLYDFDTLRHEKSLLSIEVLLALLSPIRIRDYSIASSPFENSIVVRNDVETKDDTSITTKQQHPFASIELCVAVVRETTPLGRSYNGLCTNYLANIESKLSSGNDRNNDTIINPSTIRLWIRPGSFHSLPYETNDNDNDDTPQLFKEPILCIGAGTGVAPLRALLRERQALYDVALKNQHAATKSIPGNETYNTVHTANIVSVNECDNILLFGCRKESVDFYYQKEWFEMESKGILVLLTAFSRDQSHKTYVQHVLQNEEDDSNFVVEFLVQRHGCIYIAGNPNMAKAIKETLIDIIKDATNGDEQKAIQFVSQLQRKGKFAVEAWS